MVYEVIGLPGAGKTYVAERISKEKGIVRITFSHDTLWGKIKKIALVKLFAFLHPVLFLSLLKAAWVESRGDKKLRKHKVRFLLLNALAREMKAIFSRKAVLDEGISNFLLVSLFEGRADVKMLERYRNYIYKSRVLYIVEAPKGVRQKRMQERGRFPRAGLGEKYKESHEKQVEENYKVLKQFFIEKCNAQVIQNG